MRRLLVSLAVLTLSCPVQSASGKDSRYHTFDYENGSTFQLSTIVGTKQMVLFSKGERIRAITLSDPSAYSVHISPSGDSITLQANGSREPIMMNVVTDLRSYELALVPTLNGTVPQVIDFSYASGEGRQERQMPDQADDAIWRLSGAKALRPISISDDGKKTYIAWGQEQPMPAVFAIGVTGDEEMVEGYVRAGLLTIDRVYRQLVFRIDRQSAQAKRLLARKHKKHD